jgi:hypothetical protein
MFYLDTMISIYNVCVVPSCRSISCAAMECATPRLVVGLSVVESWFVVVVWWCCLCPACGPSRQVDRRIVSRLVVSVVGLSRHDRNTNYNSLLRLLVVSAER